MLKGLVNLFKCCKSQNRQNRETQEAINYRETEKNQNEISNKNPDRFSSEKSIATKNTNENSTPNKNKTPEANWKMKEMDIANCDVHYQSKVNDSEKEEEENKTEIKNNEKNKNTNNNNNAKAGNDKEKKIRENINDSNYVTNDFLIEIPHDKQAAVVVNEDVNWNKNNFENGKENRETTKKEVELDFDKVIVPEKYIREDEKDCLIWVNKLFYFYF